MTTEDELVTTIHHWTVTQLQWQSTIDIPFPGDLKDFN